MRASSGAPTRFDADPGGRLATDRLVDKYRRREPVDFDEMLEAAVATCEASFQQNPCGPFVRVLEPGGARHFDMHGVGNRLSARALWHRDLPRLVKATEATTVVVVSHELLAHLAAPPIGPSTATSTVGIDCLDAAGRHEQAVCLVQIGARSATRLVEWRLASIVLEELRDADNDPARIRAQLAFNRRHRHTTSP